MKRVIRSILLCGLLCSLLSVSAFGADVTYHLDELGMSITLPDDLIVFTRDTDSSDPNLSLYGFTMDELSSILVERDIYLNASDRDVNYEMIVTMTDTTLEDFHRADDTLMDAITSFLPESYESAGTTFMGSDVYQHSQTNFIKIYFSQPNNDDTAYSVQYYTVYNGQSIYVSLHSYSGQITSDQEALLKGVVDTVHFDAEPGPSAPPAPTQAVSEPEPEPSASPTPTQVDPEPQSEDISIWVVLLLSLLFTIAVYTLPIAIYRYAILKRPVPRKKALQITIIYAIVVFIVMTAILAALGSGGAGGAVVLWSLVNYRILRGKKGQEPDEPAQGAATEPWHITETPRATAVLEFDGRQRQCRRCGETIHGKAKRCPGCGKRLSTAALLLRSVLLVLLAAFILIGGYVGLTYQRAVSAMNSREFIQAQKILDQIPASERFFPAQHAYIEAGILMETGKYARAYTAFCALDDPAVSTVMLNELKTKIYAEGQEAYRSGDMEAAEESFTAIQGYKRSEDYLLLISCKSSRVTSIANGEELLALAGFEDAGELILNSEQLTIDFLLGRWEDGCTEPCYFEMAETESGGYSSWYNLPAADLEGMFHLSSGVYYIEQAGADPVEAFQFSILGQDTISVYCCADGSTYQLYRQ